jgi:hypothetical protein
MLMMDWYGMHPISCGHATSLKLASERHGPAWLGRGGESSARECWRVLDACIRRLEVEERCRDSQVQQVVDRMIRQVCGSSPCPAQLHLNRPLRSPGGMVVLEFS